MNYYLTTPTETELYHYGVKGMKWGVRRKQSPKRTTGHYTTNASTLGRAMVSKIGSKPISSYKKPTLNPIDRETVLSYLMTNMTREQRSKHIISKPIGDHVFTFVKKSEGDYEIIDMKPIE